MAQITLKGNPINTIGELPAIGSQAPNFTLIKHDLSPVSLEDLKGKKVVLNIFPSVDTGTCATSVRQFNQVAGELDNTIVVCVSKDLPFAFKRFCGAEGIENVITGSDFREGSFGESYQLTFKDGPLTGLLSRSIVVINEEGKIVHTQQVSETVDEPDYESALKSIA